MKFYSRQRKLPTVIIVSLIDILAILLIFVIVTTTFKSEQPEIVIKLPESTTATAAPNPTESESLFVDKEGVVTFKAQKFTNETIEQLTPVLLDFLKTSNNAPIALQADKLAPFGTIIRLIDVLKQAGVSNLPAFTESK